MIVGAVIIVVVVLILAGVAVALLFLSGSRTPQEVALRWLFDAGFGKAKGMADKTIAKVIGGTVYTQTIDWYSNFLAPYQGNTHVQISNLNRVPDTEVDRSLQSLADSAIQLVKNDYGITVSEYSYVHFWLTGLGYYGQELTIGLLKVGSSWYIGYATDVVNLGNL